MREVFEFCVDKNSDTVYTASFEVPYSCMRISISWDTPDGVSQYGTIAVLDSKGRIRLQKMLGCNEKLVGIGQDNKETTIGGIPGQIEAGMWTIKIYIPMEYLRKYIGDASIPVRLTVSDEDYTITDHIGDCIWADKDFNYSGYDTDRIYKKGKGWYKGDLHTHTRLSDGKESPERVMEKAHMMKLDYYMATEHNVMHTAWPESDILVLPGVELTTSLGHANLFGLRGRPDFINDVLEQSSNDKALLGLLKYIAGWCRGNRVLFSINHPFLYEWKWLYNELPLEDVSCLEIINDPTYESVETAHAHEANEQAVRMADLLWADGYQICAVGGSDSHNRIDELYEGATEPSIAGDPATWLYMEELSAQNVYGALRNCHACITRYIDEFGIELFADEEKIYPGGEINREANIISWKISIKTKTHKPALFVMIDGEKTELLLKSMDDVHYEGSGVISLSNEKYCWMRFGAAGEAGEFMMYTNPIFKGTKKHSLHTFGEAKEMLAL